MNNNQIPPDSDNLPTPVVGYSFEQNEYIRLLENEIEKLISVLDRPAAERYVAKQDAMKLLIDNMTYWTDYESWRQVIAEEMEVMIR